MSYRDRSPPRRNDYYYERSGFDDFRDRRGPPDRFYDSRRDTYRDNYRPGDRDRFPDDRKPTFGDLQRDREDYFRDRRNNYDRSNPDRFNDRYYPGRGSNGHGRFYNRDYRGESRGYFNYQPKKFNHRNGEPKNMYQPQRTKFSILLSNLNPNIQWQDLKDVGRKYGSVSFADCNKIKKGEGIITFHDQDSMVKAFKGMTGYNYRGYDIECEYEFPETAESGYSGQVENDHPGYYTNKAKSPSREINGEKDGEKALASKSRSRSRSKSKSRSRSRSKSVGSDRGNFI